MASVIDDRLSRLGTRRTGLDRIAALNQAEQFQVLAKSIGEQKWQKRATDKPFTRYALGAMQAVDDDYTKVSIETAERVGKQLANSLPNTPAFRLQGSVPLDIHIRGVSDVDLLVITTEFWTYDKTGALSGQGFYGNPSPRTSVEVLKALRVESHKILKDKYPAATVDNSGGKAIKISGGTLARPVDVVPSHWHDTVVYQRTLQEVARGITIFDSKLATTIDNLPFVHISLIKDRCNRLSGGLRKSIRLSKNLKADLEAEGKEIALSSFEIAGLLYYADDAALSRGSVYELAILAETQRFFDFLYHNADYAYSLYAPDGSRKLIQTAAKYDAVKQFSVQLDVLAKEVASEHSFTFSKSAERYLSDGRKILNETYVPF